jgi:hypothetical protein
MNRGAITISAGPRLRVAMILAIIADLLQVVVFPLFVVGAESPADDILDIGIGGVLIYLLGCTGNFCHRLSPSSCPESIWFLSGRWRLQMYIENRNASWPPLKEFARKTRREETNVIRKQRASRRNETGKRENEQY